MAGAPGYDCLLLAAGESTRMGEWKLLLPWRGATVVEWSVRHALGFCRRVLLVTGHRSRELQALFTGWPAVEPVENREYRRGLLSSIQAGATRVESERFFIALGDMPLVGEAIYRLLAERLPAAGCPSPPARGPGALPGIAAPPAIGAGAAARGCTAARPTFAGRKGHPVLLDRSLIPRIVAADPALTMSDVLRGTRVLELPVEDEGVVGDLDTPSDYARRSGP
jgi:molybdenum cofactor cytidylyltransferase